MQPDVAEIDPIVVPEEMPVKVCFYMFFPSGGIGRYTHELVAAMNDIPEVQLEVVCSPDYQWRDSAAYEVWSGLSNLAHPVPLLRRLKFLKGQFVNPKRLFRRAEMVRADIVHLSNINHVSYPFWRSHLERSGVRIALTAHDVKRRTAIFSRGWDDSQLRAVYRRADALFVHSEYQARELTSFAGVPEDRIHVVPHGPYAYSTPSSDRQVLRARYGVDHAAQVALFFGHIRDDKNLDGFLRAVKTATPEVHVVVAGNGGSKSRGINYYRDLARSEGIQNRVTFLDRYIPDSEVGDLFTLADWIALPYKESFTSQSGVLNVAAHFNRPVLVSSSPVMKETVERSGIGVACRGDDVASLRAGIALMNEQLEKRVPHDFAEYRRLHSWRQNAEITLKVYRQLLEMPTQQ